MNFLKNFTVSTKIVLVVTILGLIFLAVPLFFLLLNIRSQLVSQSLTSLQAEAVAESSKIKTVINEVEDTMFSLSGTPPIQGMFRALENNGFDEQENSTYNQWRKRLAVIFAAEVNYVGLYDQLRYINENGQEIIRVNLINSRSEIVPDDQLQNKADRPYFKEAMEMDSPELYVSAVELNREGQPPSIEVPYKPVIRYAVPVFDTQGNRRGVIIANVLFDALSARTEFLSSTQSLFYLADSDGYFLVHPEKEKLWGGPIDLNTNDNLVNFFPEISDIIFNQTSGVFSGQKDVFAFARAYPDPQNKDYYWIVLKQESIDDLFSPINRLINITIIISLFIFSLAFLIFIYGIKRILRPLKVISGVAEKIGEGDFDQQVEFTTKDEIGFLAKSLNSTATKLKNSYTNLENKVKEKTKALQANVDELERTKSAMINILEDVSEEKNKTKILADDLQKFKLAVDNASDHIIITDANGIILYSNQAAMKITGYSQAEVLGKKAVILWGLSMPNKFYDKLWDVIKKKKKTFIGEIQNTRKNGQIYPAIVSISPVLDAKNKVIFYVIIERDITKEKEVDKAKTEFVSLASHQLRTPLSSINWYAEMLLSGDAGRLTKEQRQFIQEIYDGNQRMVDLVNALLNVSRIEMGTFAIEPEAVDLKKLAQSALSDLEPMIVEKNIQIKEKYSPKLKKYFGDRKLLLIIFQNLLSNAVKYTPSKGKVQLEVKQDDVKKLISITVSDTGYGIPKAQQSQIFSKLFRADNVKQQDSSGTGLGLYIIKAIIDEFKGKIWFESEENKGTTFYVELPLAGMKSKKGSKPLE